MSTLGRELNLPHLISALCSRQENLQILFTSICGTGCWLLWKLFLYTVYNMKQNFSFILDLYVFFFFSPLCYFKIILYNLTKSVAFCLLDRLMQKEQQRTFFWMSASQLTLFWKRKKQHFQQKRSSGVCTASRVHVAAMNKMLLKAILLSWEVSGICACGMLFWTKSSPLFRQHT